MSDNKKLMDKGIKYMLYALPLMFIGPSVMYNAFMNKHTNWHYLVLIIGCAICILSVILAFKGLKTMTNALFND